MTDARANRRPGGIASLAACLLLGALYAALRGPDASWDLRNYHLYAAWAALHGRLSLDLAPAGMQSFFNPLLDLPYFLLGTGPLQHLPRVLAGVQGLWYGALVFVLLKLALRLAAVAGRRFGPIDLWAVLIGATGTMAVSQAGLSSNELPLAVLILSALTLLLPLCGSLPVRRPWRRVLVAGLLCGVAAGLKPTAVVYLPAIGLALLVSLGARAVAWRMTVMLAAAAVAGFLLAYGWWGWQLWKLTGNPVFPLFNQVFHSSWLPASSGTDRQFLPRNLGQWLAYPACWLTPHARMVTETTFADPRYLLEQLAILALAAMACWRRGEPDGASRSARLLSVFAAVGYVVWLVLFSILRYAIPLEALAGLLPMLALQACPGSRQPDGQPRRWPTWVMAGLFVLVAGGSRYPGWGHGHYAAQAFDLQAPPVPPGSLVLVIGQPQAYVIPFLNDAQQSRYIGITWFNQTARGYRLDALLRQRLLAHRGPLLALVRGDPGVALDQLRPWLPTARMTGCEPVRSHFARDDAKPEATTGLHLCRLERDAPTVSGSH